MQVNQKDVQKQQSVSQDINDPQKDNSQFPHLGLDINLEQINKKYIQYMGQHAMKQVTDGYKHIQLNQKHVKIVAQFCPSIKVNLRRCQTDCAYVELCWGFFVVQLLAIRVAINGVDIHGNRVAGQGSYSRTYHTTYKKKDYVIKSVELPNKLFNPSNQQNFPIFSLQLQSPQIHYIFSQYFLALVLGHLNIGPQLQRIFGFDLIVFNDCVDFVMEKCLKIQDRHQGKSYGKVVLNGQSSNEEKIYDIRYYEGYLKQNLALMHGLRICHCDIKPDNLMWSERLQKPLFVDFGLSKIMKQPIGNKTLTKFVGTYMFCSNQMRRIYNSKQAAQIDLYWNDCISLQNTVQNIKNKQKIFENNHEGTSYNQYDFYHKFADYYGYQNFNSNLYPSTMQHNIHKIEYLVGFLHLKWFLFYADKNKALDVIDKQKYLIHSMIKILNEEFIHSNSQEQGSVVKSIRSKLEENNRKFCAFDQYFCEYLCKYYAEKSDMEILQLKYEILLIKNQSKQQKKQEQKILQKLLSYLSCPHPNPSTRSKLLQKLSKHLNIMLDKKIQKIEIYQYNEILNFLHKLISTLNNKTYLQKIRLCYMAIHNYCKCAHVQQQIVQHDESNCQLFIGRRMAMFLRRRYWQANCYLYGHDRWVKQVQGKIVKQGSLAALIKQVALVMLKTGIGQDLAYQYDQCQKKLVKILKQQQMSEQMREILEQTLLWCHKINWLANNTKCFSISPINNLRLYLQQIQKSKQYMYPNHNISNPEVVPANQYKQIGFYHRFAMYNKMDILQQQVQYFIKIFERPSANSSMGQQENSTILLGQIEYMMRCHQIRNSYLKIKLFQVYIHNYKKTLKSNTQNPKIPQHQIQLLLQTYIDGMNQTITIIQNEIHDIPPQTIQLSLKTLKQSYQLYDFLIQYIGINNYSQSIDSTLFTICQSLRCYQPNQLCLFVDKLLQACPTLLAVFRSDVKIWGYGIFLLIRQVKILYCCLGCRQVQLKDTIAQLYQMQLQYSQGQSWQNMPQLTLLTLSLKLQQPKTVYPSFICLTKRIKEQVNEQNNPFFEYIISSAVRKICEVAFSTYQTQQILSYCNQITLLQIKEHYLLAIVVVWVYSYSLLVQDYFQCVIINMNHKIRLYILACFGINRIKLGQMRRQLKLILFSNFKSVRVDVTRRKNYIMIKRLIRMGCSQSINTVKEVLENRLKYLRKKKSNSDLRQAFVQRLVTNMQKMRQNLCKVRF